MNRTEASCLGGVHSLLYFAYTCTRDLFIGGLFTLQKRLYGMIFFKIKVNNCILIHPINNYKFFWESFKNTLIYLYYIFFLILQVSNSFEYTSIIATAVATTVYPLNFWRQIRTQIPSTMTKNTKTLNPKFSRVQKELPPASYSEKEPPPATQKP